MSGTALPVSFVIGGAVAILAAYSYLKLSVRYPSVGGASQFLVEEYGVGLRRGALNIFQYFAYIIAIALYARGFAGYATTVFPNSTAAWLDEAFAVGVVETCDRDATQHLFGQFLESVFSEAQRV